MNKRKRIINGKVIFSILIVVLLVVVIVTLSLMNRVQYTDDYFVTDDTKIVLSMDADESAFENSAYVPPITHVVYYYSGDTINNVKVFYEYKNEQVAKKANSNLPTDDKEWATGKALNGKYVIYDMKKEEFEGLSAEDIRSSVESIMESQGFDREYSLTRGYNGEDIVEDN